MLARISDIFGFIIKPIVDLMSWFTIPTADKNKIPRTKQNPKKKICKYKIHKYIIPCQDIGPLRVRWPLMWSSVGREVLLKRLTFSVTEDDCLDGPMGNLKAYFTRSTWVVERDGLIYDNVSFERDLCNALNRVLGTSLSRRDIGCSELGLQTKTFVDLDVSPAGIEQILQALGIGAK